MLGGFFMGFACFAIFAAALADGSVAPTPPPPPEEITFEVEGPEQKLATSEPSKGRIPSARPYEAFTGKVTGSRLRVRLQPNLDGMIIKEVKQGDLVVVTGEVDDFYVVKPEPECKGYIYRAYVLDNIVEANHVNVRLGPDTNAPILTQVGQGDHITGSICPTNSKWLMVDLPQTVRFYMAKDYIANVGDASLYTRVKMRQQQMSQKLDTIAKNIQNELNHSFADIQLVSYVNDLKTIIAQNNDLPEIADRAQGLMKSMQEKYLQLSLGRPLSTESDVPATPPAPVSQIAMVDAPAASSPDMNAAPIRHLSSFVLEQQEMGVIDQALRSGKAPGKDAFYAEELRHALEIIGQLVPYDRPVKNRPGDFMLVDTKTKVPMAYLYSSTVDLHQFAGQTLRLLVSPRPNHHFALPAYFVLEANPHM
jgi:hypothetical protein